MHSQMIRRMTHSDWNVPCPACIEIDNIYVNNPNITRIFFNIEEWEAIFSFYHDIFQDI